MDVRPNRVDIVVNGIEFDEGAFRDRGHIDFELVSTFPSCMKTANSRTPMRSM